MRADGDNSELAVLWTVDPPNAPRRRGLVLYVRFPEGDSTGARHGLIVMGIQARMPRPSLLQQTKRFANLFELDRVLLLRPQALDDLFGLTCVQQQKRW